MEATVCSATRVGQPHGWALRMPNAVTAAEPVIRLGCLLGMLLHTLIMRLLFPLAAVGMAFFAEAKGWGLFNLVHLPGWVAIPVAGSCSISSSTASM
jgi:hypothetical protein